MSELKTQQKVEIRRDPSRKGWFVTVGDTFELITGGMPEIQEMKISQGVLNEHTLEQVVEYLRSKHNIPDDFDFVTDNVKVITEPLMIHCIYYVIKF